MADGVLVNDEGCLFDVDGYPGLGFTGITISTGKMRAGEYDPAYRKDGLSGIMSLVRKLLDEVCWDALSFRVERPAGLEDGLGPLAALLDRLECGSAVQLFDIELINESAGPRKYWKERCIWFVGERSQFDDGQLA